MYRSNVHVAAGLLLPALCTQLEGACQENSINEVLKPYPLVAVLCESLLPTLRSAAVVDFSGEAALVESSVARGVAALECYAAALARVLVATPATLATTGLAGVLSNLFLNLDHVSSGDAVRALALACLHPASPSATQCTAVKQLAAHVTSLRAATEKALRAVRLNELDAIAAASARAQEWFLASGVFGRLFHANTSPEILEVSSCPELLRRKKD